MGFAVPHFATGRGDRFRISASDIAQRDSPFCCPIGLSLRSRIRAGSIRLDPAPPRSPFDPAGALNLAVRRSVPAAVAGLDARRIVDGERDLTHSQRRFLAHALDVLADLLPASGEAAGVDYLLGEDIIGRVETGALRGAVTVSAVHLHTADGRTHEAVRLRTGPLRPPTEADHDWVAAAAAALSTDESVPPDARLRISEFSLLDGAARCAFDGARADASTLFARRGAPLWSALDGTAFRPGSACAACPALRVCPAVPARPGVLGVPGPAVATRTLSASDLAAYARCPTEFRALRGDHLPDRFGPDADPGPSFAARDRGVAAHAWLAWAHSRRPARRCTADDLPEPGTEAAVAAVAAAGVTAEAYAAAHPYLRGHLGLCPLGREDFTGWEAERVLVCHDPDADAVVITTPDLTYHLDGGDAAIWRETKTSATVPADVPSALRRYPDFALDVVLLAARARDQAGPSLAELEVLTPQGAEVLAVSTGDAGAVADARSLVAGLAGRFVTDLEFVRRPSGACAGCAAHGWCDPPDDPGPGPGGVHGH